MATVEDVRNMPAAPEPEVTEQPAEPTAAETTIPFKPIHALILDAGPLIKNDPPVSTLLAQAHELYTLPSVVSEIRDAATRSRVETTLLPFLKLRSPRPASIKFITDFARRTGDLEVLSRPDIHLMALAYELECEMNGGDWRLRKTPGQKGVNGKSPAQIEKEKVEAEAEASSNTEEAPITEESDKSENTTWVAESSEPAEADSPSTEQEQVSIAEEAVVQTLESLALEEPETPIADLATASTSTDEVKPQEEEDDDEGWITPSNLKKHQAKDQQALPEQPVQRVLKVALLTHGCCDAMAASR
ncbi:hypothetical protein O1611_g9944 [Lasiodiplodia mahajangana]|uniref:Uncharacterized protein n=1 Tax=Lasiodiplodia mahajangana TaxID=1108764 RepID=A0ACC2J4C1_9PEZI|nr:hypothetical protein O1611_g9944 [Lasiodiplodia mahajangana]